MAYQRYGRTPEERRSAWESRVEYERTQVPEGMKLLCDLPPGGIFYLPLGHLPRVKTVATSNLLVSDDGSVPALPPGNPRVRLLILSFSLKGKQSWTRHSGFEHVFDTGTTLTEMLDMLPVPAKSEAKTVFDVKRAADIASGKGRETPKLWTRRDGRKGRRRRGRKYRPPEHERRTEGKTVEVQGGDTE